MFSIGDRSNGAGEGADGGEGEGGGEDGSAKLRRSFIISTTFDSLVNVIGPCLLDFNARSSQPMPQSPAQ
eukprot:5404984-Pleurochrysis_carterae.AAC.1